MYHFQVAVTLTLTSDLVFIVIFMSVRPSVCLSHFVSGAYLLHSLRQEFQIKCVDASWDGRVSRTIFGSL